MDTEDKTLSYYNKFKKDFTILDKRSKELGIDTLNFNEKYKYIMYPSTIITFTLSAILISFLLLLLFQFLPIIGVYLFISITFEQLFYISYLTILYKYIYKQYYYSSN